jgi:predicted secreted hydrolase
VAASSRRTRSRGDGAAPWRSATRRPWIATLLAALVLIGCAPSVYDAPYPRRPVELPADDASHAAPIEWWYWVGHLDLDDGRELAFQLTFFEAYAPPALRIAGLPSHWIVEKGVVGHAAVVDLDAGRHAMAQRGFALWDGATSQQELDVSVNDWRVVRAEDGVSHAVRFTVGRHAFDLTLTPTKPASLHGRPPGIQTMGPGGVSYYVSHTRMRVDGEVRGPCPLPAACPPVAASGQAWFDHQWGDFRIDRFGGWDWFALQFDDGEELMLYLIRDDDGAYLARSGSFVTAGGRTVPLDAQAFTLAPTGERWTSPDSGAVYPAGWRIVVPARDVDVIVRPRVAAAEMDTRATTGIVYWEGPVTVTGSRPGVGFVELTNYDRLPSRPRAEGSRSSVR